MKKFLLLQVKVGEDPTYQHSNVLASFEHKRHAQYAADLRAANAMRGRKPSEFYWWVITSAVFWAYLPEYDGMEG